MPVVTHYKAQCDRCGLTCAHEGTTKHDAEAKAKLMGWSVMPLVCAVCRVEIRRATERGEP